MRICRFLPAIFLTLGFIATLRAEVGTRTVTDGPELGILAERYRYVEPGLMELRGNKAGLRVAYSKTDETGRHGRIELLLSYGRLRYTSQGTGSMNDVPDTHYDVRMLIGQDFGPRHGITLLPYFGLGYRYLYNDLRGTSTTGARGYRRESSYLYAPLGVTGRWNRLLANLEIDFLLKGRQSSHLGDTGLGFSDIDNKQKRGIGGRASVFHDAGDFAIGPWITVWRIADSDYASPAPGWIGLEPKNRTTETGIELRMRF